MMMGSCCMMERAIMVNDGEIHHAICLLAWKQHLMLHANFRPHYQFACVVVVCLLCVRCS